MTRLTLAIHFAAMSSDAPIVALMLFVSAVAIFIAVQRTLELGERQ